MSGGNHGHIGIITKEMIYATIFTTPYNAPVEPGGTSTVNLQETIEKC